VPATATERCERDVLSIVLCVTNSNEIRKRTGNEPMLCQAMDFTTASGVNALTRAGETVMRMRDLGDHLARPAVLQRGTLGPFTEFAAEPKVELSSFRGRAVPKASHDSNRSRGRFRFSPGAELGRVFLPLFDLPACRHAF
jgi:hypothetical protein